MTSKSLKVSRNQANSTQIARGDLGMESAGRAPGVCIKIP